jgi:HD-GYP domain-containing protein (c-di-GMP phosphodiesterase class II)
VALINHSQLVLSGDIQDIKRQYGEPMLKAVFVDETLYHHEKVSGDGYPEGLEGNAIPEIARIFAIADVFDALTSERPYKKPFTLEKTISIMTEGKGSHFDTVFFEKFIEISEYLYNKFAMNETDLREEHQNIITRYFYNESQILR